MMYDIIINGNVEQTTEHPNWVRWAEHPGSFEAVSFDKREAILIPATELRDEIYANIEGMPVCRVEFPTAIIQEAGLPIPAGIDDYENVIRRLEGNGDGEN